MPPTNRQFSFSDGGFIADLAANGTFVAQGLLTEEADVEKARNLIEQKGLYGEVSCDWYNGKELPYVDNLINLLLCKSTTQVPEPELMRVIAPGGTLLVNGPGGWGKTVKPYPTGMDEWNQFLHGADNNGVSLDDVGPPQRLPWHDAADSKLLAIQARREPRPPRPPSLETSPRMCRVETTRWGEPAGQIAHLHLS